MAKWVCGVEPTMFLYMLAYMLTSVVEEDMIVYKACTATHGYSREICSNISKPQYQTEKQIVQVTVSWYHMWENIASHAIPTVLALILGSWSDKVGRKIPLLMGLTGGVIYSAALLINSLLDKWRVEWILLMGALPCGLTGGPLAVFMAAFSYLADTTTAEDRTFRTTLLEVSYLVTMPSGVALGSYLFNKVFDRSHAAMFALNCTFLIFSIIYSWCALEWNTAKRVCPKDVKSEVEISQTNGSMKRVSISETSDFIQDKVHRSGTDDSNKCNENVPSICFISGNIDENQYTQRFFFKNNFINSFRKCSRRFVLYIFRHVTESIKTLVRPRPDQRRKLLYLCLISLALYTFQREEKHSIYLYTQLRFNWDLATFSMFRTFQSVLYIVGLLVGVPFLNRLLNVRDTVTMMIGAVSHTAARMTFSLAKNKEMIYVGGALGLLGPIVAPVIRSSVSKLVPSSERGKVFALLSVSDMAVPLVSGAMYSSVYSWTLTTFPQAVFILTIISQIIVFSTAIWMECLLKGENISQAVEEDQDSKIRKSVQCVE